MGAGVSCHDKEAPITINKQYCNRYVSYDGTANNLLVVYGHGRTPASCITDKTTLGSTVNLTSQCTNSMTILKAKAVIHCEGVMCMKGHRTLLNMKRGSSISVSNNARLILYSTLVIEKNARLEVKEGACFEILWPLYITEGNSVTVVGDMTIAYPITISDPVSMETPNPLNRYGRSGDVNWSEEDSTFLVDLICFLTYALKIEPELILPQVIPTICQRYDVLMPLEPYKVHTNRFDEVKGCPYLKCHTDSTPTESTK